MKFIGDLLDYAEQGYFDVIVHGCHCHNLMGAGFAKQVAERYPLAAKSDKYSTWGDRSKLGNFTHALVGKNHRFRIINGYIQYRYGPRWQKNGDIDALRSVFKHVAQLFPDCRIGYPLIGCGTAGLDWSEVSKVIDEELAGLNHALVVPGDSNVIRKSNV